MAIPNEYPTDNVIRVSAKFRNAAGNLADPGTVTLKYRSPEGSITTVAEGSLTNDGVGLWHYDIPVDAIGPWRYTWIGDLSRTELTFKSVPSVFAA